ncbi:MAG: cell wall hydrolase [Lachnospiraceae bacterium]|nr:cell wall hydrolase [Lachnospiraceae bacterium]
MKSFKKIALILVLSLFLGLYPSSGQGESVVYAAKTTQQKIEEAEKNKDKLESQLDDKNDKADALESQQKSLKKELKELNTKLQEVVDRLTELEEQISTKEQEIAETQLALEAAREKEQWQYDCMVIRVRDMYERNDQSYLNALLSIGKFADLLNVADYFERVAAYDQQMLADYKDTRKQVEEQEAQLQQEKLELEALQLEAETQKARVNGLISQTSNSIADYEDQLDEVEKEIKEYEAKLKEQEKDLKALKKKLAEELALSQAAQNAAWRDISQIQFAEGDRYLLANLIYCEAGGEPYEGQLAVGAVVMNRVLSSRYPDTVVGVIYQKSQFSPAGSGRLAYALSVNKATTKCYRAADEAMSGMTNVGNCLYFRTPVPHITPRYVIGGHIFY